MLKDLLYAIRMLWKNPGFVAVAVCSLAIGIGANSAVYSLANALVLRPLAVKQPSRIITISPASSGSFGIHSVISYPDYADLRDRNRTFEGVLASSDAQFGFAPDRHTQPRMKFGMFVSGNFFKVLGIEPTIGRGFRKEEDQVAGRDAVVVLSHELWRGEFGGDPSVIGRKIWLTGTEFTVIGVAPQSFRGLEEVKPALYAPLAMAAALWDSKHLTQRDIPWLDVKARLKPGIGLAQAQADITSIAAALRKMYPKADDNLQLKAETEFEVHVKQSGPDTGFVVMLALLAVCVLLVACANVAGLLLSRSTVRAREIAVRLAVGAGRWSLVRQLLIENFLISAAGAIAGLGVASGVDAFFNTLPLPTDVPVDLSARLDGGALTFTLCIAVASTFLFGLVPALRSTKLDLVSSLKEKEGTGSRRSRLWGRNLIVTGQVALSLVLLIVSGVLLQGFNSQLNRGPGFRIDHLQLMSFDPGLVHYTDSQKESFYKRLLEKTKQTPGVESAALTSGIPMSMSGMSTIGVLQEGKQLKRGEHPEDIFDSVVTPGYFQCMAIAIVSGRQFLDTDQASSPLVAVVNEHMARHYWPDENPVGKRVRVGDGPARLVQVVGVAKQSKYIWISESPGDFLYLPFSQNPQSGVFLVAQSKGPDAAALVPVLRHVVQGIDKDMPVFDVRTMASLYESRAVTTPHMITALVAGLGTMGLILSVIGLYGVISYSVSRRRREFGIRMAVGADRQRLIRMVLGQGAVLGLSGIALGLIAGVFVSEAVTSLMLFSFGPLKATPFIVVSLLLLVTTMAGVYIPARRASRVDPMRALREE